MPSKILVRKYMTLAEFVAYLTNGRLPTDELFERQFDAAYPFDKQAFQSSELRARCILELGLVHATGYRYTRLPLLSLPFISVVTLIGFIGCSLFKRKIDNLIKGRPLTAGLTACSLLGSPFAFKMLKPHYRIEQYRRLKRKYCPEKQLYIDFIAAEEAAACRFVEKDSYLPLQTPAAVLNKTLKTALNLENRFAEYSAVDLRQEIVKRALAVPEKRIEALLGVLPHKAKGGCPVGKKDEKLRHTVSD